ncbi:MAG: methionyl aminopeptidase [bacterium]|nr:methionyl aminopeptidase [bacterium]
MTKLSRNDPCWCGSGKKYKKCHLASDLEKGTGPEKDAKAPVGVLVKTEEQIEGIRASSQLSKEILDILEDRVEEGITTNKINQWVHDYTIEHGAEPAPLNYNGFPKSVCTSINNVICHGIPDYTVLKNGDIINVDVTCLLDGYFGDASRMFLIGDPGEEARNLVKVARECLHIGIEQVKPNNDIGEIGYAIEKHAKSHRYSVVRDYGGHGIGLKFHEQPHIHHYGKKNRGVIMVPDMVFTIEPMINAGKHHTRLLSDNWTAITADGSLSAQWEHTVRVTETGVEILTG